jgi:hypothetical protein
MSSIRTMAGAALVVSTAFTVQAMLAQGQAPAQPTVAGAQGATPARPALVPDADGQIVKSEKQTFKMEVVTRDL